MHVARAVGREGIVISVNLGGPKDVRIVIGAVDGIEETTPSTAWPPTVTMGPG